MKKQRYIAWVLLVVSIVMLTASVVPHHHHQHILCMQQTEMESVEGCCEQECGESGFHRGQNAETHQHTCGYGCVTKFRIVPSDKDQENVLPFYSFSSLLYTIADVLSVDFSLCETIADFSSFYLHKLQLTCFPHVIGLRAPPFAY